MIHRQVKSVFAPLGPVFFFEENTPKGIGQITGCICPELGWLVDLILTWKCHCTNEASLTKA